MRGAEERRGEERSGEPLRCGCAARQSGKERGAEERRREEQRGERLGCVEAERRREGEREAGL